MSVKDLSEKLGVSQVTIRRDLEVLQEQNLITKFHGSAMFKHTDTPAALFDLTLQKNGEQKRAIAKAAASLIRPNDVISIDSSSTTYCISEFMPASFPVKVITNHLLASLKFIGLPNVDVIQLGGVLSPSTISASDYFAVKLCREFHSDIAFLSASSFSVPSGGFDMIAAYLEMKKTFIDIASRVVFMVDSSKISKKALYVSVPLHNMDTIITDDHIAADTLSYLEDAGKELIIVNAKTKTVAQHINPISN